MEFGKLHNIDNINFSLPADHPTTHRVLSVYDTSPDFEAYVGAPVWSSKEWVGKLYPDSAKEKDYLKYYGQKFNTIELNTTHYRIPDLATIQRWKQAVPAGFKFCPKFPQQISHDQLLQHTQALTETFCSAVMQLEDKLGVSFLQLPPYFSPKQLPILENFLNELPAGFSLAIEFRHPDWFSGSPQAEAGFHLLESKGISTVISDVAGRRDVLHMHLTTPVAFIRFIGNGLHPTDFARTDEWLQRIAAWKAQGLQQLYFFTHEPDNALAPDLAAYLIPNLNQQLQTQLKEITFYPKPIQGSLF